MIRFAVGIALLGIVTIARAAEEQVNVQEVPPAVRQTLARVAPARHFTAAIVTHEAGRTIYAFDFADGGTARQFLRIADDGHVIPAAGVATNSAPGPSAVAVEAGIPPPEVRHLTVDDLPRVVRGVVQRQSAGRPIDDISADTTNGKKRYVTSWKENGRTVRSVVDETGAVISPPEHQAGWGPGLTFEQLPPPVKRAVQSAIAGGAITDISHVRREEPPSYYLVTVDRPQGEFHLSVLEDGRILNDSRRR